MKQTNSNYQLSRRAFSKTLHCTGLCFACGLFVPSVLANETEIFRKFRTEPLPDLKKLTFCGYHCGDHCKFFVATKTGDNAVKREFVQKHMPEKLKDFEKNPDAYFCWGCKVEPEKMGPMVKTCKIRSCVIERKLDCCVQCRDLNDCGKLFPDIPSHKKLMVILQERFMKEKGLTI